MSKTNRKPRILDLRHTLAGLRYIAKSPPVEWGGFDPTVVQTAKSALHHLARTGPDWRKVAKERLDKLNILERQCVVLRDSLATTLELELNTQLNIRCVPMGAYENKLKSIAKVVAERVCPKLPTAK
jgi:hypothetical protein